MGYQKAVDPKTGKEGFELPDRYLQRAGGYMAFYAAVLQSQQWPLSHPCGISAAWQFLARCLCTAYCIPACMLFIACLLASKADALPCLLG